MNKVLVTGGLGFIGSHTVVELVNQGYEPILVDDLSNSRLEILERLLELTGQKLPFHQFDLTNEKETLELFAEYDFDAVIHFAAHKAVGESVVNPLKYYRNNLVSLINLLHACEKQNTRNFIFSSSCTVYGQPDQLPVTEETLIKDAESPYGNTKQIGEEIIEDFCNVNEALRAISLRYFNPVGAHSSAKIGELPVGVPNNLVPFITQTAMGIRDKLSVFGGDYNTPDGTCIRDYIHVVDLAEAHIAALEYSEKMDSNYDVFNAGTGKGCSVLEVIKAFEEVSGVSLNYEIVNRRAGDIEKIYADTKKINETLGWKSKLDINEMMESAWNWQKSLSTNPIK